MDHSRHDSGADRPRGVVGSRDDEPAEVAADLRAAGDAIAARERDRALARLEEPTLRQRATVDALARGLVECTLAAPISRLGSDGPPAEVASEVRQLFDLDPRSDDPSDRGE